MGEFFRLVAATLLGALITFGTTLFFERRREGRDAATAAEAQSLELRRAARLVWHELISTHADLAIGTGVASSRPRWWIAPPPDFSLAAWEAQREVLAVRLGDAEWSAVAMVYSALERLNQSLASFRDGVNQGDGLDGWDPHAGTDMTDEWAGELAGYRVEMGHAIEHLRPIAGPGIVSA